MPYYYTAYRTPYRQFMASSIVVLLVVLITFVASSRTIADRSHAGEFGASTASTASTASMASTMVTSALTPLLTAKAFRGAVSITSVNGRDDTPETTTTSLQFAADSDGRIDRYRTDVLSWCAGTKSSEQVSEHTTEVCDGKCIYTYKHGSNEYTKSLYHSRSVMDTLQLPPTDLKWNFHASKRRSAEPDDCLCATSGAESWKVFIAPTTHALHMIVHQVGNGSSRRTMTIQIVTLGLNSQAMLMDGAFYFQPPFGAREAAL